MSSESGWIPWKDRTDLNEYFIIVRYDESDREFEHIFPFLRKIPEKCLDEIRNDIQDLACNHYENWDIITSVVVYLYSYKDCSREEKKMILRGQILRRNLDTQDIEKFDYHKDFINEALSIIDICEQLEKEEFDNGVIGVDNGTVPEAESASAPNAGDSPAAPFFPKYDGSDDWISLADVAEMMVKAGASIDINSAKKNISNQKSKGEKHYEKDGKHLAYGESIHGKWRVILIGGKRCTMFYKPSLKIKGR